MPEYWTNSTTTATGSFLNDPWQLPRGVPETWRRRGMLITETAQALNAREWQRRERVAQMQRSVDAVMGAAANAEAAREGRAVYEELRTAQSRARDKARQLLLARLSPEQRGDYERHRHFFVNAPSGRRYRIRHGRARNIDQVDPAGCRIRTLCAHPAIDCPDEDTMLTQKLWLETQEELFLRTANVS